MSNDTNSWYDEWKAKQRIKAALIDSRLDEARLWEVSDYWGGCPTCLKNDGYLNVGRANIFVCNEHRVRWTVGSNLFSDWRYEPEEVWERNAARIADYQEIEFLINPTCRGHEDACRRCGARGTEKHHPVCRREDGTCTSVPDHLVRILLEVITPRNVLKAIIAKEEESTTRNCII